MRKLNLTVWFLVVQLNLATLSAGSLRFQALFWDSDSGAATNLSLDYAAKINNQGTIAGMISLSDGSTKAATESIHSPGTVEIAIPLPYSSADGVNNAGQVVVNAETANGYLYSFFWSSSTGLQQIGQRDTIVESINDSGTAVGQTTESLPRAYQWDCKLRAKPNRGHIHVSGHRYQRFWRNNLSRRPASIWN
jgi:hypothetical protein